jgi:hypothetical protein
MLLLQLSQCVTEQGGNLRWWGNCSIAQVTHELTLGVFALLSVVRDWCGLLLQRVFHSFH